VTSAFSVGDPVRVVMTKWSDRPHWEFGATYLGSDAYGDWLGIPAGTTMTRPGVDYVAPVAQVGLVPGPGSDVERGWLATFHDEGGPVRVYVDMTTPPVWDGATLRAVDLDLDVIEGPTGRVWVDDEDEFARHRVELGYPDDVVALATASCAWIRGLLAEGAAPFDGSARRWFAELFRQSA
jgi:uncharacterized protein